MTGALRLQQDISTVKSDVKTLVDEQRQIRDQLNELKRILSANTAPPAPPLPAKLSIDGEPFKGDVTSHFAIIEYTDFECPYCGKFSRETYPQILADYIKTGKVKYLYRDMPSPAHPHALLAARAARCAGEQGKFWEMHDSLFSNQAALATKDLSDRASSLSLDAAQFGQCLSSEKYTDEIRRNISEAQTMGINATPTFLLGIVGTSHGDVTVKKGVVGAQPYEVFKAALDELLASQAQ